MGKRGAWDPAEHSPDERERRASALMELDAAERQLRRAMSDASEHGLADTELWQRAKTHHKGHRRVRRRGPHSIEKAVRRATQLAEKLESQVHRKREKARDALALAPTRPTTLELGSAAPAPGSSMRSPESLTRERARVRARIAASYIGSDLSSEEVAEQWRGRFHEALEGTLTAAVSDLDPRMYGEFKTVSARSVRRWAVSIREERSLADDPDQLVWEEVLAHRMPRHQVRPRRKRTPKLKRKVLDIISVRPESTGVHIAGTLGEDVSERTIQRLLREDISAAAEIYARTGGKGMRETLWRRLGRRPPHPMHTVIIDDSHLSEDAVEARRIDVPSDYDIKITFPVSHRVPQGQGWILKRHEELFLQVAVDAYSGMTLVSRIFTRRPRSLDTLATVARIGHRYGLPEVVYTDNGGNFTSRLVRRRMSGAGIRMSTSIPGEPRGRGKVERRFGDIKQHFFGGLRTYVGRDELTENLYTVGELKHLLEEWLEERRNNRVQKRTGMSPRECFDRERPARQIDVRRILSLLEVEEGAVMEADGIRWQDGIYYCPELGAYPDDQQFNIYFDPYDYDRIWVLYPTHDGREEWVGEAKRLDAQNPAPPIGEQRRAEKEVIERAIGPLEARKAEQDKELRRNRAKIRGQQLAQQELEQQLSDAGLPVWGEE